MNSPYEQIDRDPFLVQADKGRLYAVETHTRLRDWVVGALHDDPVDALHNARALVGILERRLVALDPRYLGGEVPR